MGQPAGSAESVHSAPERGSVIFFDLLCTVGLEGGVELVTKGEVGSWFSTKADMFKVLIAFCGGFRKTRLCSAVLTDYPEVVKDKEYSR